MTTDTRSKTSINRRSALRRITTLGVAGAVGISGLQYFAVRPVFALDDQSLTAADVSISSADGMINDIWFQPELVYSWADLDSSPSTITFTLYAEYDALNGSYEELGSEIQSGLSASEMSGGGSYDFQNKISLINSSNSWTKWQFHAAEDGSTKEVGPIGVRIKAELTTSDGRTYTDTSEAEFTVDVTNKQVQFGDEGAEGSATGGVGGIAGTGGN